MTKRADYIIMFQI